MQENAGHSTSAIPVGDLRRDGDLEVSFEAPAVLPDVYDDNRLVALPRDPLWFFTYWEVSSHRWAELRRQYEDFDRARWMLKVFDVTDGDAAAPVASFDVSVGARQWYVKAPRSGRAYIAKLGFLLPDGRFIEVLISNRIRLPRGRVSEKTDSRFVAIGFGESETEQWNRLLEVSGSRQLGSVELARVMAQRWEFLKSVSSGSWSSAALANSASYLLNFQLPEDEEKS